MGHPITVHLTDEQYESLVRIAGWARWTPEECVGHWVTRRIREINDDKILKLAGCLKVGDLGPAEAHDEPFAEEYEEEMRLGG